MLILKRSRRILTSIAPETETGTSEGEVELWPEPVATIVVLEELIACIGRHVVAQPHELLVIALWFMMAWVHDAAHWSVYLVVTAPDIACGKTTLVIDVGSRLLPRPAAMGGRLTEATLFRLIDAEQPTVLLDNADELFRRDKDVRDLFIVGYTRSAAKIRRNTKIGRDWVPVEYNVFCPKIVSLLGKLPPALESRCLVINLLRALPNEELIEVNEFNDELMGQLEALKRKLARWGADNLAALKNATPVFPAGLATRPKNNAKLLLSIAELASPELAEMARAALERLLSERESSWLERLLQELWVVFFEEKRKDIASQELISKRLCANPTSEWCNYQDKGRRPNQWDIGHLFKPVGIFSRQVGKRRVGGYHRKDFIENRIFERWLRRQPLNLSQPPPKPKKKHGRSRKARG
jgi:putative DNA primase/helicase